MPTEAVAASIRSSQRFADLVPVQQLLAGESAFVRDQAGDLGRDVEVGERAVAMERNARGSVIVQRGYRSGWAVPDTLL